MESQQIAKDRLDIRNWNRDSNFISACRLDYAAPALPATLYSRLLVSVAQHSPRRGDRSSLFVDNVVGRARARETMELAGARPRRSQTCSRRALPFCSTSDLHWHARHDR